MNIIAQLEKEQMAAVAAKMILPCGIAQSIGSAPPSQAAGTWNRIHEHQPFAEILRAAIRRHPEI